MVTQGTSVPELRSQIAFIAREVAALEAQLVRANDDNTKLTEGNAEVEKQLSDIKARNRKSNEDFFSQKARETAQTRERDNLNHRA